jgi:hypothetical protein
MWFWWACVGVLTIAAALIAAWQLLSSGSPSPSSEIQAILNTVTAPAPPRLVRGPVDTMPAKVGPFVDRTAEIAEIAATALRERAGGLNGHRDLR